MNTAPNSRVPKAGTVREAVVAGIFYPSAGQELHSAVVRFLDAARSPAGNYRAVISPHGSLSYSGSVAALAWKAVSGRKYGRVVIISPAHRNFESGIFLPKSESFAISTGTVEVDRHMVRHLHHCSTFCVVDDLPHLEEHGIEMQLPFMAEVLPDALLVPIIVSGSDATMLNTLMKCLLVALGEDLGSTLFVLSSNMGVSDSEAECESLTESFASTLLARDFPRLNGIPHPESSFCGRPIVSAFAQSSLLGGETPVFFGSSTSAPCRSEKDEPFVGYAAFGFPG